MNAGLAWTINAVARLVLGPVYVYAGWVKLPDPAGNVRQVQLFRILPDSLTGPVGHGQPLVEIALGLLILFGLFTRTSGVLSALFQLAFIAAIASVWVRGIEIDCGCFSTGGERAGASAQYPWDIARDTGFLLLSLALVWWPRSAFSLDHLLFRRTDLGLEELEGS